MRNILETYILKCEYKINPSDANDISYMTHIEMSLGICQTNFQPSSELTLFSLIPRATGRIVSAPLFVYVSFKVGMAQPTAH